MGCSVDICSGVILHGLQGTTCSTMFSSMGCRKISAITPETPPPLLLLWPWCSFCFFLTLFVPSSSSSLSVTIFALPQRCCQCGRGAQLYSAVGLVGVGWDRLCPAQGSPSLSSQRPPCSHLTTKPRRGHPTHCCGPKSRLKPLL